MWNIQALGRSWRCHKKLIKYSAIVVVILEPLVGENMMQQLATFLEFPNYCYNENMGGIYGYFGSQMWSLILFLRQIN